MSLLLAALVVSAVPSAAQQISDDEYLRFIPLDYPRLTRQTPASERFHLYGDRWSTAYRDVDPVDGVDDDRFSVLQALAVRFAPFMVQNTYSAPMDFKKLMRGQSTFNLFVDTWDLAQGLQLVHRETVDFNRLGTGQCSADATSRLLGDTESADCRILSLIDEFDPDSPKAPQSRTSAVEIATDRFKVLFFDMPGYDPETWRATYANPVTHQLRTEFHDAVKIYAHPFIGEVPGGSARATGFDFYIQYWFYYPLNDGGNNHEGDWEHIDVAITPRSKAGQPLSADDVRAILAGEGMSSRTADDPLVIERVEYYFHHKVMTLDYGRPNVYQPYEAWEREWRAMTRERLGSERVWRTIRRYAYRDPDESEVNTHPIAYIGADNKGLDQLISSPGGRNQDSHGTFPFPGLYKTVGPAGSAEQVAQAFDHWDWYAKLPESRAPTPKAFGPGHVLLFDDTARVDVVPDWERVHPLIRSDPAVRREWAWLVLPLRWGYPATRSPAAGLVAHADMGNVGPVGPAYNDGWNRSGTGRGFEAYKPHTLPSFFPLEPQDGFSNNLGYFNVLPALTNLPPLGFIWRFLALPFRALLKRQDPIYYPEQSVPPRFIGLVGGPTYTTVPDKMWFSVAHLTDDNAVDVLGQPLPRALRDIAIAILSRDSVGGEGIDVRDISNASWGVQGQFSFYVGRRFMSATGFRHSRHAIGFDQPLGASGTYQFRADVNWWDITGNIRYDVLTGGFKPYLNFGYGVNWYRLEDMTSDGESFDEPTGPWIYNFWPLTWQYGFGAELMLVQSFSPIPKGIDLGVRVDFLTLNGPNGIDLPGSLSIATFREVPGRWNRRAVNLSLNVSF